MKGVPSTHGITTKLLALATGFLLTGTGLQLQFLHLHLQFRGANAFITTTQQPGFVFHRIGIAIANPKTKVPTNNAPTITSTNNRLWVLQLQSEPIEDDDDDDEQELEYGKFLSPEDPSDKLPPLPDFLNEPLASYSPPPPLSRRSSTVNTGTNAINSANKANTINSINSPTKDNIENTIQATQLILRQQQEQIDLLIKTLQSQATPTLTPQQPTTITTTTSTLPPLKVMLFIDGTWLYYSIYERPKKACPISQHYSTMRNPWHMTHRVDWDAIPTLVADCLTQHVGWSSHQPRSISIERAFCFTSYKKDTSPTSHRVRMFDDMRDANFDVYIMETVGPGEKCVDIQLAVEMMHYATIPDAYDVAVLLSGDKDFLPAMVRTRQKARKVALMSMRTACNRALYETPNVLDYDVIWMEDYVDRWVLEKEEAAGDGVATDAQISTLTLLKVIYDYILHSGMDKVSSRDIGRYLKTMEIGPPGHDASLLDQIKILLGGLYRFLDYHKDVFELVRRSIKEEKAGMRNDAGDRAFWVALQPNAGQYLAKEFKGASLTKQEVQFFKTYTLDRLSNTDEEYPCSRAMLDDPKNSRPISVRQFTGPGVANNSNGSVMLERPPPTPSVEIFDYSQLTVTNLKEICRERGLQVSGTKAMLLERIQNDLPPSKTQTQSPKPSARSNESQFPDTPQSRFFNNYIEEYLIASGGEASSRDVGRYLAAAPGLRGRGSSALSELKETFGSLRALVDSNHAKLYRIDSDVLYEFRIGLTQK